jgi:hypothetical protein
MFDAKKEKAAHWVAFFMVLGKASTMMGCGFWPF